MYGLVFLTDFVSGYRRSVGSRAVSIVSDDCDQSSSTLFYVVFKSLY